MPCINATAKVGSSLTNPTRPSYCETVLLLHFDISEFEKSRSENCSVQFPC